jgi:hypothetical protein
MPLQRELFERLKKLLRLVLRTVKRSTPRRDRPPGLKNLRFTTIVPRVSGNH